MLLDEVPAEASGPENMEIAFRPPVIGRILSERFVIEDDLSDPALAGRYSSHRVKDLKQFCSEVILSIVNFTPVVEPGPSFRQICEALIHISHANIEGVLETGVLFDGRPFAISRTTEGEHLDRLIRNGRRLELEHAARIVEQAAEGLSAAHRKGILHCDLRPSNLVVSDEGRRPDSVKILHFGAAWPVDVRGDRFAHLPTDSECFIYSAPETFAKLGHRSSASDVYSLAVIAYRLITGRLPFESSDPAELLEMISREKYEPPTELRTDVTFETENILRSGLRFEPAWRPQNIEDFAYRLVSSMRPAPKVSPIQVLQAEPVDLLETRSSYESAEAAAESLATVQSQAYVRGPRRIPSIVSDRVVTWALIILLLAAALSIPIVQTFLKEEKAEAAVGTMLDRTPEDRSKRQLKFWLESKSAERPIQIAEAAKSTLNNALIALVPDSAGEIYVIGESSDAEGHIVYKLLSQQAGNGPVVGGKALRTSPNDLSGSQALWIVWTATKLQDLETGLNGATAANPVEEAARKLRHFLERNRNLRLEVDSDENGVETVLNGIGDRMVYRLTFPGN